MGSNTSFTSSMLGIRDQLPAMACRAPSGPVTTPEPSTVSTVSLLEPVRAPMQSDATWPTSGQMIQGPHHQLHNTRELSMSPRHGSPSTTSAAFPDMFPSMADAVRHQRPPSPGITGAGAAMGVQHGQVALSPGTIPAALPMGEPRVPRAPSQHASPANRLPFSTVAQHHHHLHHHHHHCPETMSLGRPPFEAETPAGGVLSELLNRRAELQLHGVPLDSGQRQPRADALSELQDRRAELELHGIHFGTLPREPMPLAQQRTPGASKVAFGSHPVGEQRPDFWPPALQQPSYQGTFRPPGQQAPARMPSHLDPFRMLQPGCQGAAPSLRQQAPHAMQQIQPDFFWRAIPQLVEATDFSENAPALSRGSMRAILQSPEALGLQATAPSQLSRTASAELAFPGMDLAGQSFENLQPSGGRLAAVPDSPDFLPIDGTAHGPMSSGQARGNASRARPMQQLGMRRAAAAQSVLPPDFNLVLRASNWPGSQLQSNQRPQPLQSFTLLQPNELRPSAPIAAAVNPRQVRLAHHVCS